MNPSGYLVSDLLDTNVVFRNVRTGRLNKGKIFQIGRRHAIIHDRSSELKKIEWATVELVKGTPAP